MSLIVDIHKDLGSFKLDAAFEAENGITSILGASGCGKSMTLKCIAGIEKPDSGHIELDGRVLFDSKRHINLRPQQRQVGYLFQNYALFPNMTLRRNILVGMKTVYVRQVEEKLAQKQIWLPSELRRFLGWLREIACRKERAQRLDEILTMMQLQEQKKHRPHQLSGGQQQRAAVARILVSEPKLLLLDEPFSALDAHLRDSLKVELRDMLQSFGREVLMVTHSREEAYNMSGSIAVMDRGRVLTKKPTKELFADPGSVPAAILTGCKNIAEARKTGEYEVEIPDWGIRLETAQPVADGLKAVGIRAHYFNPGTPRNRFPVAYAEEMEEPFETTIQFRYAAQAPGTPPLWWRLPKDKRPAQFPAELGIAPANVLLLYE